MKFPRDVIVIIIIIFIIWLKKQENNLSKVIKLEIVYQICFLCFLLFKTIWTVIITFQYICDIKDPLLNLPTSQPYLFLTDTHLKWSWEMQSASICRGTEIPTKVQQLLQLECSETEAMFLSWQIRSTWQDMEPCMGWRNVKAHY